MSRTEELTHNYGTEKEEGPKYHPGNQPQEGDRPGCRHSDLDGFGITARLSEENGELILAGQRWKWDETDMQKLR